MLTSHATDRLRAIISNLYMLIVQAHDYQGQGTQQAMSAEMYVRKHDSSTTQILQV
jgi:hypothetical protein